MGVAPVMDGRGSRVSIKVEDAGEDADIVDGPRFVTSVVEPVLWVPVKSRYKVTHCVPVWLN